MTTPPRNPLAVSIEQQGILLKLNRPTRIAAGFGVLVAAVAVLVLSAGNVGYASDHGTARRGQPCDVAGSYARDRSGDLYRCEKRKDDDCPVWHSAEPKPGDWGQPEPCECPSKSPSTSPSKSPSTSPSKSASPSPSKSASTSPSASVSPSKSPTAAGSATASPTKPAPSTTPVGNTAQLPVTGVNVPMLVGGGLALITAGFLLYRRSRRTA